jgi:transcriptional regulator with XRE-family HTH domain
MTVRDARPLLQPREATIVIMPSAADRHSEAFGHVAERQVLEAGQFQRGALTLGELGQARPQHPAAFFARQTRGVLTEFVSGFDRFTAIARTPAQHILAAHRPPIRILQEPPSHGTPRRIVEMRLPVDLEKHLLGAVFGLGPVLENVGSDSVDQAGVSTEERVQGLPLAVTHRPYQLGVAHGPDDWADDTDRSCYHSVRTLDRWFYRPRLCGTQRRVPRRKSVVDTPPARPAVLRPLGAQLRRLRLDRHMTQEKLAELASLNYKYIGRVELGKADPGADVLVRLARALSVPVGELFDTITPMGTPLGASFRWLPGDVDNVMATLQELTAAIARLLANQPRPTSLKRARRSAR